MKPIARRVPRNCGGQQIDLASVINPRPLRSASRALLAVGAVGLAALAWDHAAVATAAVRLLTPWSAVEWPRQHHLEFAAAPERLARGQNFTATVVNRTGAAPDDARIEYRVRVGSEWRVETQPLEVAGNELLASRENVQRSFDYRAAGGDDTQMPWRSLEVVDPPTLGELKINATPPEYSGLAAGPVDRHLRVLAGTKLELSGSSSEILSGAEIEVEDAPAVPLTIDTAEPRRFSTSAEGWTPPAPETTGAAQRYRLRLKNAEGLVGVSRYWRLTVSADTPPEVTWREPNGDLFVTPQATVKLAANVTDNLAIKSAEFGWRKELAPADDKADDDEAAAPRENPVTRVTIYNGPTTPPAQPEGLAAAGDRQVVEYAWELSEAKLSAGDQLEVLIGASDYLPQLGRTKLPRRIFIISPEQLNERLAKGQTSLLNELRRTLALERSANEANRSLAIDAQEQSNHERAAQDKLTTLAYEQRKVGAAVADERGGALQLAKSLLAELRNNRVERPELEAQLEGIATELKRLVESPLQQADEALAAARRTGESLLEKQSNANAERLAAELNRSGAAQQETIQSLEGLVEGLTKWSDFQRFAQEVAELERAQRELAQATAKESARSAASGPLDAMRSRAERAKLTDRQAEIGRRFDKVMQSMQKLLADKEANEASSEDAAKQNVADAVAEAEDRGLSGKLRDAAREVASSNFGRAQAQQTEAAKDLKELLDTLRDRAPGDLRQLAKDLREMEQRLADMQKAAEPLKKNEGAPAEKSQLAKSLAQAADRAARQLRRMTASAAGASAAQGAQQLSQAGEQQDGEPGEQQQGQQQQAQQAQNAQQQLAKAQQQAAQRRQEVETQVAQQVLNRLNQMIGGFQESERNILQQTIKLSQAAEIVSPQVEPVERKQRDLEAEIAGMADELAVKPVFELSLRGAAGDMRAAADRLAEADVSRPTQQLETAAIQRLKHIADVLKANQQDQQDQPAQPPGNGGGGGAQKPPSPVDVAELKMLRLMQLDLNARTSDFAAEFSQNPTPTAAETANRLATEQNRLRELVEELMRRKPVEPEEAQNEAEE